MMQRTMVMMVIFLALQYLTFSFGEDDNDIAVEDGPLQSAAGGPWQNDDFPPPPERQPSQNRYQFNITRKHSLPVSPTTAAIMALLQAIVLSVIVIVGLFCGPDPRAKKAESSSGGQKRVKMERSV